MKKKFIVIDGNSILHRSYYAIPALQTSSGEVVNAVFGFASMLLYLIEREHPDYLAVGFDRGKKTFRAKAYPEYKAQRKSAPDDLYVQLPRIQEMLGYFGIPHYSHDDFEADDVLGTLSHLAHHTGSLNTLILTSDLDALQLIKPDVWVSVPNSFTTTTVYNSPAVEKRFGLQVDQMIDYKGLRGDTSDNLPGVKGVGEKTAVTLLQKYGTLENLYEHIDDISGALKQKLIDGQESAFLCKKMATIVVDAPFNLELDKKNYIEQMKITQLQNLFRTLEFNRLTTRLEKLFPPAEEMSSQEESSLFQSSLF